MESCLVIEHAMSVMPDLEMDEVHLGQLIVLAIGLFLVGLGRVIYGLIGNGVYSPFVNLTAEHDFVGLGRTLITTQVTPPLLPVLTPIDSRGRTYGNCRRFRGRRHGQGQRNG